MSIVKLQKLGWNLIDGHEICSDFGIVYAGNSVIEDQINCDGSVDYAHFVTRKIAVENVIGFDAGVFAVKKGASLVWEFVEVDENDI